MKVAIVYDRVNKWGGAERVLLALKEMYPDAPLYTSVYNAKGAPWAKEFSIRTSFLQHIPLASAHHEWYPLCMPLAFEKFNFDQFDLVLSVTSEAAKGIITRPGTIHICYCLTPTRYLWSGQGEYFRDSFFKTLSIPAISYLKTWDKAAAARPDHYICISQEVKRRVEKYYNRPSTVIYPPVTILDEGYASPNENSTGKYFLVVSRLVPYKRIDIAIEACNRLGLTLKIIGHGSEEGKLRSISGPTIEFLGNLTDKDLVRYYRGCKALIFSGVEDFGLVAVEAQLFGKPVISYKKGGALETVIEGRTGVFFDQQSVESCSEAIQKSMQIKFDPDSSRRHAKRFGLARFKREISSEIQRIMQE